MSDFSVFVEDGESILTFSVLSPVTLVSYAKEQASSLHLSLPLADGNSLLLGSSISLAYKGQVAFSGFIFTKTSIDEKVITIIAFDQIRYLQNKDTFQYRNLKASDLLQHIGKRFNLSLGSIKDTSFVIPYRLLEEKTLLDMIYDALEMTFLHTGKRYTVSDVKGKLTLESEEELVTDFWLDKESYESTMHHTSINNLYNKITIIRQDDRSGFKMIHEAEDKASQSAYGILQYHKRIPVKTDTPGLMTNQLLRDLNKVEASIYIKKALGIPFLKGGHRIYYGKEARKATVKKVTHHVSGIHLMDLELIPHADF